MRTLALWLAGYRCQRCTAAGRLEVHHRTYRRFGRELLADVQVLCWSCHRKKHRRRRPKRKRVSMPERSHSALGRRLRRQIRHAQSHLDEVDLLMVTAMEADSP